MRSRYFILDIETKADDRFLFTYMKHLKPPKNYKDKEKIDAWYKGKRQEALQDMAKDTNLCKVFCIGLKEIGKPAELISMQKFCRLMHERHVNLITYNGKHFDIPALIKWAIKLGLNLPLDKMYNMTKHGFNNNHLDLMELVHGRNFVSKSITTEIFCGLSSIPIDFATCTDDELRDHCIEDLDETEALYKKFVGMVPEFSIAE